MHLSIFFSFWRDIEDAGSFIYCIAYMTLKTDRKDQYTQKSIVKQKNINISTNQQFVC